MKTQKIYTIEAYKSFIKDYPDSKYKYDVEKKIQEFELLIAKQDLGKKIEELIKSKNIIELYNLRSTLTNSLKNMVEDAIAETEDVLIRSFNNNFSLPLKIYKNNDYVYKYSFKNPEDSEEKGVVLSTEFNEDSMPSLKIEIEDPFDEGQFLVFYTEATGDIAFKKVPTSKEYYYDETLWRFYGNTKIKEYTFASSGNIPICFYLKYGVGAIYLYGKGQVYKNGKLIKKF